jgi:hypothetical protein
LVKKFKELGWEEAVTSRYASKMMDDAKVDLCNTEPFYIQAKCVKRAPNIRAILDEMPDTENYNVIAWKVPQANEQYAMLRLTDFYELIEMLKKNNIV